MTPLVRITHDLGSWYPRCWVLPTDVDFFYSDFWRTAPEAIRRTSMVGIQAYCVDALLDLGGNLDADVVNTRRRYDASTIRVMETREVIEAFVWAKAGELSARSGKSVDWIRRGLEACERAGVPHTYFIRRYIDGDKSVMLNPDVNEAMADINKECRPSNRELCPKLERDAA